MGVCPLRNRSGAVTNRAYRQRTREPPVAGDRLIAIGQDPAILHYRDRDVRTPSIAGDRLIAIGQDPAILPYRNGARGKQKKARREEIKNPARTI